jgi:hypothetical protein
VKRHRNTNRSVFTSLLICALALLVSLTGNAINPTDAAPAEFADRAFRQVWDRTDAPVLSGKAQRSWYWGPEPGKTLSEPYSGSKNGTRLVQYFDKARMEINNPNGDRNSEWFVTTGLLVVEMVSGKQQVGDKEYKPLRPAEIAVGGDGLSADPDAPTYTSFRLVTSLAGPGSNRAQKRTGQVATATIDRAGQVGDNTGLGLYPGTKLVAYSDTFGHNIPQAMWDFLNMKGQVQQNGSLLDGQTLANWVFMMGYPITEPYWSRIKIGGTYHDALFQLYERRTLAYIPSFTKGWQVQMGNVGQHYYRWLYGGPLASPVVPASTPDPATLPLPPSIDASVEPQTAPVGTSLVMSIEGFRAGEGIVSWFTGPDGTATDARITPLAGPDGRVNNIPVPTHSLSPGVWAITFHGKASNQEAIAYFRLTPAPTPVAGVSATPTRPAQTPTAAQPVATGSPLPASSPTRVPTRTPAPPRGSVTPTATYPVVPTQPPAGLILSVRPGAGPPDAQFTFTASGLAPGEQVQVKFTDPNRVEVYPAGSNNGRYAAGADGKLAFTLVPSQAFPAAPLGVWLFELRGEQSGSEGVIGFTLR